MDEDGPLSQKNGITAVHTFVMKQDRLVGAQAYEMVEGLKEANGVRKAPGL